MRKKVKAIFLISVCSTLLLTGCGTSTAETTNRIMNDVDKRVENGINEIKNKWDSFADSHKNSEELDNADVETLCEEIITIEENLCTSICESVLECANKTVSSGEEVENKCNTLEYLSRRVSDTNSKFYGFVSGELTSSIDQYLNRDIGDGTLYNSDSEEGEAYREWFDTFYNQFGDLKYDLKMDINDTLSKTRSLTLEIASGIVSERKSGSSSYLNEKIEELEELIEERK